MEYEEAVAYLTTRFKKKFQRPVHQLYPFETCATDTTQIERILNAVFDTILQKNMERGGML